MRNIEYWFILGHNYYASANRGRRWLPQTAWRCRQFTNTLLFSDCKAEGGVGGRPRTSPSSTVCRNSWLVNRLFKHNVTCTCAASEQHHCITWTGVMSLRLAVMANIQSSIVLYRCWSWSPLQLLDRAWTEDGESRTSRQFVEKLYVIQNAYCWRHTDPSLTNLMSKCVCECTCMFVRVSIQNQSHKRSSQAADVQASALEGWLISRFVLNINSHLIHRHQSHKATEFRTPRTRPAESSKVPHNKRKGRFLAFIERICSQN